MIKILGIKIFYMKEYFRKNYGKEDYDDLISQIKPKESRDIVAGTILSGKWYDNKVWVDFQKAVVKKFGKDALRDAEYDNAQRHLTGFFAFIIKMISLKTILKKSKSLWLKNFSQGNLYPVSIDDKKLVIRLDGFPTQDIQYWAITKSLERMASIISGKTYEGKYKKVGADDIEMVFTVVGDDR